MSLRKFAGTCREITRGGDWTRSESVDYANFIGELLALRHEPFQHSAVDCGAIHLAAQNHLERRAVRTRLDDRREKIFDFPKLSEMSPDNVLKTGMGARFIVGPHRAAEIEERLKRTIAPDDDIGKIYRSVSIPLAARNRYRE